MCNSSYGHYAYSWSNIGDRDWQDFLAGLEYGYLMSKIDQPRCGVQFSSDKTKQQMENIIYGLKDSDMIGLSTALGALADLRDDFGCHSEEGFYALVDLSENLSQIFPSYHDVPIETEKHPDARGFWEYIWQPMVKELSELEPTRSPGLVYMPKQWG